MSEQHPNRIIVLPECEAIRRRPRMYVPNLSTEGLHWLAGELVRAAIEPLYQNQCSRLRLVIGADGTLTQSDNGPGLPVNPRSPTDPRSVLDIALTSLFAGRDPPPSFYTHYGFLVCFGPILNSLSESLDITTHRDGRAYRTSYARGYLTEPLHEIESTGVRGSIICFQPDPAIWHETGFALDALYEIVHPLSANYPTVTITLYDERLDKEISLPSYAKSQI